MIAAPAARPSSPSVRLTALVVAVTRNQIHSMNSPSGSTSAVSRRNEIASEAGVRPSASGNCSDSQANDERDGRLAEQLGARPHAGAALLEDLQVVVGDADQAEAHRQVEDEQARTRLTGRHTSRCAPK